MACQPLWDAWRPWKNRISPTGEAHIDESRRAAAHPADGRATGRGRAAAHHRRSLRRHRRTGDRASSPREISIGDYVLSGGELPAMVLIDAVVRLMPGVLGTMNRRCTIRSAPGPNACSITRITPAPRQWDGQSVPDVLTSGDHAAIEQWRRQQREERTPPAATGSAAETKTKGTWAPEPTSADNQGLLP
jgi:hypothetical protein